MRIIVVSAKYGGVPIGGAEIACEQFVNWLIRQRHEVLVVTIATARADLDLRVEGTKPAIVRLPSQYPYDFDGKSSRSILRKIQWHLIDHFGNENRGELRRIISGFRPDLINIQIIQGFGYRYIKTFAQSGSLILLTLHDYGFACIRMTLFSGGAQCDKLCLMCKISKTIKKIYLNGGRYAVWSPSRALLGKLVKQNLFGDVAKLASPLPLHFGFYKNSGTLAKSGTGVSVTLPRLLYVGRLHVTKGVEVALEACRRVIAVDGIQLELIVAGTGEDETRLRSLYGSAGWCTFLGRVDQDTVRELMLSARCLLVPSLWGENSPLVVYQAIEAGLPVLSSEKGGLPELVVDGENGEIIEAGNIDLWHRAVKRWVSMPEADVAFAKSRVRALQDRYSQDGLARRVLDFVRPMIGSEEE